MDVYHQPRRMQNLGISLKRNFLQRQKPQYRGICIAMILVAWFDKIGPIVGTHTKYSRLSSHVAPILCWMDILI